MTLALTGDRRLLELKEIAEELIKPRLEQIEGIGSAEVTGGVEREILVEVDPAKVALYGLTIDEVSSRIDAFNRNLQGGTIRKGTFKYSLRVVGEYETIGEISEISLRVIEKRRRHPPSGRGLRSAKRSKERQGITRLDGKESIGLQVRKEAGANTVKATQAVREVLEAIRKENPGGRDPGRRGAIAVHRGGHRRPSRARSSRARCWPSWSCCLFLQEWKTPLIIDTVIPISVIGTFSLMYFNNITLNIMSLGGLALGVGMLDDCAVVVSENIFRHRSLGKSVKEAAYEGTREVGGAIVATALTTVVVFLPVVYVRGVAGQLFKDTALTVTYSLCASLLVSLTLIATLQSRTFTPSGLDGGKPLVLDLGSRPGLGRAKRRHPALAVPGAAVAGLCGIQRHPVCPESSS